MPSCPKCQTELKGGLLSSVSLLSERKVRIINEYHTTQSEGYCSKCGPALFTEYQGKLEFERSRLIIDIKTQLTIIPVISAQNPLNWDYQVLEMVTGQSTTGTGVISEFTSSFTDFFGAQSGQFNKKLKDGENICLAQLRKQALDLGGNAVIATDIDYSEVGGEKGMLMVCMAGTAIHLKNPEILGAGKSDLLAKLKDTNNRIQYLTRLNAED